MQLPDGIQWGSQPQAADLAITHDRMSNRTCFRHCYLFSAVCNAARDG
jgi:hypothetical protein